MNLGKEQKTPRPEPTEKNGFNLLAIVLGVVLILTFGVIWAGWSLVEGLQDNSAKLRKYKVTETPKVASPAQPNVMVGSIGSVDMMINHELCQKLVDTGMVLEQRHKSKEALAQYEASLKQYLAEIHNRPLNADDKLHVATSYDAFSRCYVQMNDLRTALKFTDMSITLRPDRSTPYRAREMMYLTLKMYDKAQADHKAVDRILAQQRENLVNIIDLAH